MFQDSQGAEELLGIGIGEYVVSYSHCHDGISLIADDTNGLDGGDVAVRHVAASTHSPNGVAIQFIRVRFDTRSMDFFQKALLPISLSQRTHGGIASLSTTNLIDRSLFTHAAKIFTGGGELTSIDSIAFGGTTEIVLSGEVHGPPKTASAQQ